MAVKARLADAKLSCALQCTDPCRKVWFTGGDLPTYTLVTTRVCPFGVVAFTLIEFSSTVMTGAVASATTVVSEAVAQTELALKQTPSVEHLQHSAVSCRCSSDTDLKSAIKVQRH